MGPKHKKGNGTLPPGCIPHVPDYWEVRQRHCPEMSKTALWLSHLTLNGVKLLNSRGWNPWKKMYNHHQDPEAGRTYTDYFFPQTIKKKSKQPSWKLIHTLFIAQPKFNPFRVGVTRLSQPQVSPGAIEKFDSFTVGWFEKIILNFLLTYWNLKVMVYDREERRYSGW